MKKSSFVHDPKSYYAYGVDANTLEIKLRVIKGHAISVEIIYGEPFGFAFDEVRQRGDWVLDEEFVKPMEKYLTSPEYDYYIYTVNAPTKRTKYAFIIDGHYFVGPQHLFDLNDYPHERKNLANFYNFPYLLESDIFKAPSWIKDQIWYSIFPDSFNRIGGVQDDYQPWDTPRERGNFRAYGGTLQGITEKLDYIKDLGFTGIYLNPIFVSPSVHKYDTVDYFEIDPTFGTKSDLKTLVEKAHAMNLSVVLDSVFNHMSHEHPFFKDVIEKGKDSEYYDGFYLKSWPVDIEGLKQRKERPNYETFAFTYTMPKINMDHPLMQDYFIKVGKYWIENFDVDGWRLDVGNEVSHHFWRVFRKEIKAIKPDAFLLGENWYNAYAWLQGDQHDSTMNYEFLFPMWKFFGTQNIATKITAEQFVHAISDCIFSYPRPVLENLFNLVDSHDTERIAHLTHNNPKLMQLMITFLYMLPGTPSIYYGTEIGLTGEGPWDARSAMEWDTNKQDLNMKNFITKLNALYKTHAAFKSVDINWIHYDNHSIIVEKQDLLFIYSNKNQPQKLQHDILHGNFIDLFSNSNVGLSGEVTLDAYEHVVLKKLS